jgi:competence ComEA-like helix-hairpin-helix protein
MEVGKPLMKADDREDRATKPADDSSDESVDDSVDKPIVRAANQRACQPRFAVRLFPPLSDYPTPHERKALWIGLIVMAVVLLWMTVMAVQRPMKYSELAENAPWPDMRININTATEAELTVLPQIGPRLAERIVEDREANGPFYSIDDLMRVQMIGPRTVETISPYVMVKSVEVEDAPASE